MFAVHAMFLLALATVASPSYAAEERDAEAELRAVTEELNDITGWLGTASDQLASMQGDLKQSDEKIAAIGQEIRRSQAALGETEAAIAALEREQDALQRQRTDQAQRIASHVRQANRLSGQDFVKLLLSQEDPDTFDRMIRYHSYFSEARADALRDYRKTLSELETTSLELTNRQQDILSQRAELQEELDEIDAERNERRVLIANLQTEMRDKKLLKDKLDADQKRLQALISELQKRSQIVDGSTFETAKGSLRWPVNGELVHRFGETRAGGRLRWEGVYLRAPAGTTITAVASGRVVFADWLRGFGLLTIIDHGSGQMSLYGYCDTLYKRSGDWVESGETLASVGQSGGQTDDGLYFEVRKNGRPTDPLVWLAQR